MFYNNEKMHFFIKSLYVYLQEHVHSSHYLWNPSSILQYFVLVSDKVLSHTWWVRKRLYLQQYSLRFGNILFYFILPVKGLYCG